MALSLSSRLLSSHDVRFSYQGLMQLENSQIDYFYLAMLLNFQETREIYL